MNYECRITNCNKGIEVFGIAINNTYWPGIQTPGDA